MSDILKPYGSDRCSRLVSKVGSSGKSLAPYGTSDLADLVAKVGIGGKLSNARKSEQTADQRVIVIRKNPWRN